jgi:hypothetical protein
MLRPESHPLDVVSNEHEWTESHPEGEQSSEQSSEQGEPERHSGWAGVCSSARRSVRPIRPVLLAFIGIPSGTAPPEAERRCSGHRPGQRGCKPGR